MLGTQTCCHRGCSPESLRPPSAQVSCLCWDDRMAPSEGCQRSQRKGQPGPPIKGQAALCWGLQSPPVPAKPPWWTRARTWLDRASPIIRLQRHKAVVTSVASTGIHAPQALGWKEVTPKRLLVKKPLEYLSSSTNNK